MVAAGSALDLGCRVRVHRVESGIYSCLSSVRTHTDEVILSLLFVVPNSALIPMGG